MRRLAVAIDPDEPPGMAASSLARSIVTLVQDRDGKDALLLGIEIDEIAKRFRR